METKTYNGLNGTIMLNTGREGLTVGTVPGEPHGFPGFHLDVTVNVRIERAERRETYETTTHETVREPLDFSMTSNIWLPNRSDIISGGATRDPIREVAERGKPSRFWNTGTLRSLAYLGDVWHLNGMRAGCAHMTPAGTTTDERLDNTPPCPITGYRYGRAWLTEPLPEEVIAEVFGLLAGPIKNHNVYVHPEWEMER